MLSLSRNLILLYALFSPYYFFKSGSIQPADVLLFIAFLVFLYASLYSREAKPIRLMGILRDHKYVAYFVILAVMINTIWFIAIPGSQFILSSLYLIFNLLVVFLFGHFSKDTIFLKRLKNILSLNIILQVIISLLQIGRYYSPDRYMGTFNDPNQLAFYVFISLLIIFIINTLTLNHEKRSFFVWCLGLYLIYASSSTGIILGLATFLALLVLSKIAKAIFGSKNVKSRTLKGVHFSVALAVILLALLAFRQDISPGQSMPNFTEESPISQRLTGKLERASGEGDINLAEDRGLDIMYKYPQYLVVGAGAGAYNRYPLATQNNKAEIHSTLSLLFYYGIVPFLLVITWLFRQIINAPTHLKIAALALLVESIFLINYRQPLFWAAFVLIGSSYITQRRKDCTANETK